jgi:hypothetical protein
MLGNRGYYSPNTKVFEGYRGIRELNSYTLNILLMESGSNQSLINVNNYALENDANLDNAGNFTANNDQNENNYAIPNNPSGEDVVPS